MTSGMGEEVDGRPATFGCSLKELRELMEYRGHEAYTKLQRDYPGGVLELTKRLYTSPSEGGWDNTTNLVVLLHVKRLLVIQLLGVCFLWTQPMIL